MKKYPITYKNKEYMVRWTHDDWGTPYLIAYEIKKVWKFKIPVEIYRAYECEIEKELNDHNIYKNKVEPYYYKEQIQSLFRLMELYNYKNALEEERVTKLKEWDGIIE